MTATAIRAATFILRKPFLQQESRCLLGIYMLILLALFGGMIAGAVLASKSNGLEVVKDPMYNSLSAYDPKNADTGDNEKAWDSMQDSVSISFH